MWPRRETDLTPRPWQRSWRFAAAILLAMFPCDGLAATNQELVAGSRLVFPYYDVRPGRTTLFLLTNTGAFSTSIHLEFYDLTCTRRDTTLSLTAGDVAALDVGSVLTPDASGTFQQGFLDADTFDGNVLLGWALIVNTAEDWAIAYPAAPARRIPGSAIPFEPYPSRLILPAFLTPGQLDPSTVVNGLLILVAPHPTSPGAELPAQPIQAGISLFLKDRRPSSGAVAGHQVIAPIGQLVGTSLPPTLGWLDLVNHALDESGNPVGLVGLYLQTVISSVIHMGMATRLWGVPAEAPAP